jgi:IS5 family transposase
MFKTLVLQASHNLSDERTGYLIRDRLSFTRFLGLGLADTVPDANTIWTFSRSADGRPDRGHSPGLIVPQLDPVRQAVHDKAAAIRAL